MPGSPSRPAPRGEPPATRSEERSELPRQPGQTPPRPPEIGGPKGLEPTRYGDWERNGRCSDF